MLITLVPMVTGGPVALLPTPLSIVCLSFPVSCCFSHTTVGRVVDAWKQTPVEWYPIPIAVGAILLVVIQYRRKSRQASKEVQLDENGHEVIKLRGPWHVSTLPKFSLCLLTCDNRLGSRSRRTSSSQCIKVMGLYELC